VIDPADPRYGAYAGADEDPFFNPPAEELSPRDAAYEQETEN
jgi:hypothetical protein